MLILQIALSQLGQSWRALAGCCHHSLWSFQEPPLETRNLVVEYRGGQSYTREACTVQSLKYPEEGMTVEGQGGKNCLHWCQACGKACCLAGKLWGRERGITKVSPDSDGVFHIAKQMDSTNQGIVGENCVCYDAVELSLINDDKLKAWVEHFARLLNVSKSKNRVRKFDL